MYYVDYLAMIASSLKPSLNSINGASRLRNHKRSTLQKKSLEKSKSSVNEDYFWQTA